MNDEVTLTLSRKRMTVLSETVRWAIRETELNDTGKDLPVLYELHEAVLASLVGSDNVEAVITREGPMPLPVPRTWAEIEALIRPISYDAWAMFMGHARALSRSATSKHDSVFRLCAGIALRLRDEFDPSSFPPPSEIDIGKAFAAASDGLIVIPIYTDEERELIEHPFTGGEEDGV